MTIMEYLWIKIKKEIRKLQIDKFSWKMAICYENFFTKRSLVV